VHPNSHFSDLELTLSHLFAAPYAIDRALSASRRNVSRIMPVNAQTNKKAPRGRAYLYRARGVR